MAKGFLALFINKVVLYN